MKKSAKKSFDFKEYLVFPVQSIRDKGWNSPFSSTGLVLGLFLVGLLVGFVGIPQLKARILSSPTLNLRSETIDGMKVTSDLSPDVTRQAVSFLKADLNITYLPQELLLGKPAKAANNTGQEYVALWNASGKSWTLLVVVPDKTKKAIYFRAWYTGDEQTVDENSSRDLLHSVFEGNQLNKNGDIKCQSVDDAVGKSTACGSMKEINGQKEGGLVRGPIKLSDTKNGTAVSICLMTKDHPAYKDAAYCP